MDRQIVSNKHTSVTLGGSINKVSEFSPRPRPAGFSARSPTLSLRSAEREELGPVVSLGKKEKKGCFRHETQFEAISSTVDWVHQP